jgi:hypothetical protein
MKSIETKDEFGQIDNGNKSPKDEEKVNTQNIVE